MDNKLTTQNRENNVSLDKVFSQGQCYYLPVKVHAHVVLSVISV